MLIANGYPFDTAVISSANNTPSCSCHMFWVEIMWQVMHLQVVVDNKRLILFIINTPLLHSKFNFQLLGLKFQMVAFPSQPADSFSAMATLLQLLSRPQPCQHLHLLTRNSQQERENIRIIKNNKDSVQDKHWVYKDVQTLNSYCNVVDNLYWYQNETGYIDNSQAS